MNLNKRGIREQLMKLIFRLRMHRRAGNLKEMNWETVTQTRNRFHGIISIFKWNI